MSGTIVITKTSNSIVVTSPVGSSPAVQAALSELKDQLSQKVDKVQGKGLSTNDYTSADREKLAGIGFIKTFANINLTNGLPLTTDFGTRTGLTLSQFNVVCIVEDAEGWPVSGVRITKTSANVVTVVIDDSITSFVGKITLFAIPL